MLSVPSDADPTAAIQTNVMGTVHVLEAARLFEVPRVLFASSIATYGQDIGDEVIDDYTLQRPQFVYGATKLFGETLGLSYRRLYGLDFRGLRYPSIVGPGVSTPGLAQYTSWAIEKSAQGEPISIWVPPRARVPVLYYKDAARATIALGKADAERIKTINYILAGVSPVASAGELADLVRTRIPGAQIDFQVDPVFEHIDKVLKPYDDRNAQQEWGWQPSYSQEEMIDDFLLELEQHPERYE